MEDIVFIAGGAELLSDVGPLWEQLRDFHAQISKDFSHEIRAKSFHERGEEILTSVGAGLLRVDIVHAKEDAVGYCITSLREDLTGEVESIFVRETHRSLGLGSQLMSRALEWLDALGCTKKELWVLYGNERALEFYRTFAFFPRRIVLEQTAAGKR
ncbi:MAG: GNAT family N-acetyltransferase [Methanomassiliicoccales archaeon]